MYKRKRYSKRCSKIFLKSSSKSKGIKLEKSALTNFAEKYNIEGKPGLLPFDYFGEKADQIKDFLRNYRNTKVRMILVCLMENQIVKKSKGESKIIYEQNNAYFQSQTYINLEKTEVKDLLKEMIKEILNNLSVYQKKGSGWYFKEVISLEIHIVEYKPIKGGSYIPLPNFIMRKKAIINMENEDNKCFLWSILRYLHPREKHSPRINDLKKYENDLNFKEINFPVKVKDITKFENQNPDLPGINIFSLNDNNKVYPLRINKKDCQKTIDLFLHSDGEKQHYSLIKNFTRLVRSQYTSHRSSKIYICKKCLTHYTKEELLEKHIKYCGNNETVAVKMPTKENSILKFKNHFKKFPLPFVIYADFECFTIPVSSHEPNPNPNKSFTKIYQKHEPSGFCIYLKTLDGLNTNFEPIVYTKKNLNEDVSKKFIEEVVKLTHKIYQDYYQKPKPLNLTDKEEKEFQLATICHICEEDFFTDEKTGKILKVRDHCHFTGKYRGAAHNECNLSCRKPLILPVIFHNLQGYDAHLFIKKLGKVPGDLFSIPTTEEKYITFSKFIEVDQYCSKKQEKVLFKKFEIRFIDSFKFMSSSIADLVENLSPSDFKNIDGVIKHNTSSLRRKGVYPYDYVNSIKPLKETKPPPKEASYSKLDEEEISVEDYQHAHNVWNTFNCQTIQDYHDLYLKSDVLLLADVFEKFRKTCLKHYKLDPCHYYTAPGLAWDACLKLTKQELQLLTDYDKLMMFEQGIRGGMSHISKRYAEANNKYMKDFDKTKPSIFIQYLDVNGLYSWAMMQKLPTHGFKWIDVDIPKVEKLLKKKDTRKGYIFEVDLEDPQSLWKEHNDYPLAPERLKINGVDKFISSFLPKKNYVVHYRNLKQYLKMGLVLKKVHRGIEFYQSKWMKPYIKKNAKLRKAAENDFEKDFFKLMNNAVFGKTIENIRKRQNVELVDDRKKALKFSSKPNFDRATIFDEHLVAIHMKKTEVYFNKPIFVG